MIALPYSCPGMNGTNTADTFFAHGVNTAPGVTATTMTCKTNKRHQVQVRLGVGCFGAAFGIVVRCFAFVCLLSQLHLTSETSGARTLKNTAQANSTSIYFLHQAQAHTFFVVLACATCATPSTTASRSPKSRLLRSPPSDDVVPINTIDTSAC